jgi:hypothetical protein
MAVLANVNVVSDEPSLEELRAQLGPIALLVSNTIELTVVTIGSYISGALLGYFGGTILSIPSTLFDKSTGGIMSKFGALHAKAWGTCKQWGMLSAAFSGFNNFVRMVRGEKEDGWNAVWGSALTGAFLNRSGELFNALNSTETASVLYSIIVFILTTANIGLLKVDRKQ